MIEVQDEILNGEATYRIRDKDGNILFDNLTIEQITPVIQEGTQLNKVLFDSIKNDINSRLLTSNKSTTEQAVAGIDDITYMTPLKTMQALENGCKVIVNDVNVTTNNKSYSIDIDDYVTQDTLFLEITASLIDLDSTIKWCAKDNSYIKGISFSSEGNSVFSEHESIYVSSEYSNVKLKIIADIKSGFAFIFSCTYYSVSNNEYGTSGVFDMLKIVKFAEGTFGTLDFKTDTSGNTNSTFQIKEYRTI